jgi:hypothetical protein
VAEAQSSEGGSVPSDRSWVIVGHEINGASVGRDEQASIDHPHRFEAINYLCNLFEMEAEWRPEHRTWFNALAEYCLYHLPEDVDPPLLPWLLDPYSWDNGKHLTGTDLDRWPKILPWGEAHDFLVNTSPGGNFASYLSSFFLALQTDLRHWQAERQDDSSDRAGEVPADDPSDEIYFEPF